MEEDKLQNLMNSYTNAVKHISVHNETIYPFYFFNLMGAYFNNKSLRIGPRLRDLRFNLFWTQLSRTGKGELNKVQKELAESLGLTCSIISDITGEAALIGTIDSTTVQYNKNKGYNEGDTNYRDPIIYGDLYRNDIVIIDEAGILFKKDGGESKILTVLSPALDNFGKIRKKMRYDTPIEYECKASIIMTTVPLKEMKEQIMDQGFFMRCALLARSLNNITLEEMKKEKNEYNDISYFKIVEEEKKSFVNIINNTYDRNEETIIFNSECNEYLEKKEKEFSIILKEKLDPSLFNVAQSYSNVFQEFSMKMGAIIGLIYKSKEVKLEHITKTETYYDLLVSFFLNNITITLANSEIIEKQLILSLMRYNKDNNINLNMSQLIESVANKLKCSKYESRNLLLKYKNMNYFNTKTDLNGGKHLELRDGI